MADRLEIPKSRFKDFSRQTYEHAIDALAGNVAARFARGNIALQFKKVLTAERLEQEREALRRSLERAD